MKRARNKFIALCTALVIFSSCGEKPPIPEDEMEDFLVEYYILNAALRHAVRERSKLDKNAVFADFIHQHGYTVAQVDSAFAYYGARPREYEKIYEKVYKRLDEKYKEIDEQLR